jgi:hypothetical protein
LQKSCKFFAEILAKINSVAEARHFYRAPAPGKNFDAAPAPTLLYSKAKSLRGTKVQTLFETIFFT